MFFFAEIRAIKTHTPFSYVVKDMDYSGNNSTVVVNRADAGSTPASSKLLVQPSGVVIHILQNIVQSSIIKVVLE
jgi:hypothetical protein